VNKKEWFMGGCMSFCGCCEDDPSEYAVTITASSTLNADLLQRMIDNDLLGNGSDAGTLFEDNKDNSTK
jgi:hypothetical protein